MNAYRLYVLDRQDRIEDAIEDEFVDDGAALAKAETARKDEYAVEVWTGARLVARLGGAFRVG
jgi:hypothetical protein